MSATKVPFQRALIVEDSTPIRKTLVRAASAYAREVIPTASVREGFAELGRGPDLLIADVELPDGWVFDLLDSAAWRRSRAMALVVSGRASREAAFRLGQLGVDAFLWKPFGLRELESALADVAHRKRRGSSFGAATPYEAQLKAFARVHGLTAPQAMLLRALLRGTTRKQLAQTLGISENTCKTTIRRLLARCQATRVAEVVSKLMSQRTADAWVDE